MIEFLKTLKNIADKEVLSTPIISYFLNSSYDKIYPYCLLQTIMYFTLILCFSMKTLSESMYFLVPAFALNSFFLLYELFNVCFIGFNEYFSDALNFIDFGNHIAM